ncbi:MAG TPA: hypothetical protein PKY56_03975 [Candidatus Kapabacteria bacterium]|nr:hypothetical protein [Candidatus Kapabacteria bacterium]
MKTKKYLKNECQKAMMAYCIKRAKEYCNDHFEVTVDGEDISQLTGELCFTIWIKAKLKYQNTMLAFMATYHIVYIGRKGAVKSMCSRDKVAGLPKTNKYCTFL